MSSFFRRGDESSDGTSSDEENATDNDQVVASSENGFEGNGSELDTAESLSATFSRPQSIEDELDASQPSVPNVSHHRDMIFATLLEDWCRTRAAELKNETEGYKRYDRLSPEIQGLAQRLFSEAGSTLSTTGFLPSSTVSIDRQQTRRQYLAGLDGISFRNLTDADLQGAQAQVQIDAVSLKDNMAVVKQDRNNASIVKVVSEPLNSLVQQTGRLGLSTPYSDLRLATESAHSHYESSFQQVRLLGRGGFGRVYHAYNVFDRQEYAIKKIPLSPRMSQRYRNSGHQELQSVLREVQALAELEHCNIVRYHATWIEQPKHVDTPSQELRHSRPVPFTRPQQKLLAAEPYRSPPGRGLQNQSQQADVSEGIVFSLDSRRSSRHADVVGGWSAADSIRESSPVRTSNIFTDGDNRPHSNESDSSMDSTVYVLHVQMSMYPMTLSQYMSASSSTGALSEKHRHCFHLVPSLKILLGILCGLQYIHARGLIHRDIKPGNIFLSKTSRGSDVPDGFYDVGTCSRCPDQAPCHMNPRIGDFGLVTKLASLTGHEATINSRPVGTEYYRPPASREDNSNTKAAVDEKLDVFALGVILVELLWPCTTSSERLHVLKNLQFGELPLGWKSKVKDEMEGTMGQRVEDLIHSMIDPESTQRWGCSQVRETVEEILRDCKASTPHQPAAMMHAVGSEERT